MKITTSLIKDYESRFLNSNEYSPRTKDIYLRGLKHFLAFCGNAEINKDLLISYMDSLGSSTLSTKSRNLLVSAVRSFLKFANTRLLNEQNQIAYRDILLAFRLKSSARELVIPTKDEVTAFLGRLKERERVLAQIILATGLRIHEALGLKRGQLTTAFPVVGKGSKQRVVFCDLETVATVRAYEANLTVEQLFDVTPRMIQYEFLRASEGKISPHTLRHVFAVRMIERGGDIRVVQKFLGHSSIATTQRYTQVSDTYLAEAYRKLTC
jgi:site-specific recombinase XerD